MALIFAAGRIVMLTVDVRLVIAWATAVIVTILLGVGGVAGAVYRPFVSIMPTVELPLVVPLTCHVTSVLLRFDMTAVHCDCAFAFTEVTAQLAEIVGTAAGVFEPHEFKTSSAGSSAKTKIKYCQRVFWAYLQPFN